MKLVWAMLLTFFGLVPVAETLSPIPSPTPTTAIVQPSSVTINNENFAYAYVKKIDSQTLVLVPNFSKPKDVQALMTENRCASAINGGFYDTARKPLGYFFAQARTYGQNIVSPMVNGYVWEDTKGTPIISTAIPDIPYRFALQTGPVVLFNGQTMPLSIRNDEHARRMIVGKTAENTLIFLAVYSPDAVFSGPLLSDLPTVVQKISEKEKLDIADALNLDGGSASAFYSGDLRLSELTPVGSIFCMTQ